MGEGRRGVQYTMVWVGVGWAWVDKYLNRITYMSSAQGPTNFNQPQSLVKYSNPVLVSNSGKKQLKVRAPPRRT